MAEVIDYRDFAGRLARVMPRWEERDRMTPEEWTEHAADTAPRWELLREFQEAWGYVQPDGGPRWPRWTEDERQVYVKRLESGEFGENEDDDLFAGVDLALPVLKALDEWWDLPFNSFTHQPRLYWTNPVWPPTVRPDPSGYGVSEGLPPGNPFTGPDTDMRVCVMMAENQYCNEWGYPAADSAQPDPRVLVSDGEDWVLQSRSVSEFFLQLAVQRLPTHFGHTVCIGMAPEGLAERIRAELPALGLLPWRELGEQTTAYGAPDAIVFHDEGMGDFEIIAAGRTAGALERLAREFGLDWTDEIREPEPSEDTAG
ncbi:hypothetical protein ABZ897_32955 [Nonomuraea sp. NPDC046802]|uniref:hypothetical protein n=1 Tax=Nonomuraea sp. NPDC046802 TaxID=3154919 RepID=UPI0033F9A739